MPIGIHYSIQSKLRRHSCSAGTGLQVESMGGHAPFASIKAPLATRPSMTSPPASSRTTIGVLGKANDLHSLSMNFFTLRLSLIPSPTSSPLNPSLLLLGTPSHPFSGQMSTCTSRTNPRLHSHPQGTYLPFPHANMTRADRNLHRTKPNIYQPPDQSNGLESFFTPPAPTNFTPPPGTDITPNNVNNHQATTHGLDSAASFGMGAAAAEISSSSNESGGPPSPADEESQI